MTTLLTILFLNCCWRGKMMMPYRIIPLRCRLAVHRLCAIIARVFYVLMRL
ncbi:hypothetical protein [Cardiobacterium valvarum]|uniref:hypothetical protein n=1 Tax=Cardiobacterium valvarum TaxID=194702 RepID=UPI0015590C03|nr:hypothetical protein [Cardiobacterium valvarum]